MNHRKVRAYLVRNDGTREPFTWSGGHTRYVSKNHDDGTSTLTTFAVGDGDIHPDGTLLFFEGETRDVTTEMDDARRRIEERHWDVLRKGLCYDEDMAAKDAEIARLRGEAGT